MGSGTITGNVTNSGTLAPGNSIGILTITGNYTQTAWSVYEVEVNAAGESDRINVSGAAALNGGTLTVLTETGTYSMSNDYTILSAGSVIGSYYNVTSDLAFLDPSLTYDSTSVYLTLQRNDVAFEDMAETPNQRSVAASLDEIDPNVSGDMLDVMGSLYSLNAEGARAAYNQMGGLIHTAVTGVSLSGLNNYIGSIADRMAGLFSDNASNRQMSDFKDNEGHRPRWGLWTKGFRNKGDKKGDDISSKYDYNGSRLAMGMEMDLSDAVLIGLSVGYSETDTDMKELSETASIAGVQGSFYGTYKRDACYADGLFAYVQNRYETAREISFGDITRTAKAEYTGDSLTVYAEAGRIFNAATINIIPIAALQATRISREEFKETGAGALDLAGEEQETKAVTGYIGVRMRKEFSLTAGDITPEFRAVRVHGFSGDDYTLNAAFTGYESSGFDVKGKGLSSDSLALGLGLTWEIYEKLNLSLGYDANISGDHADHGASMELNYRW